MEAFAELLTTKYEAGVGEQPEGMGEQSPDDLRHDDRDVEHDRDHQPLLTSGVPGLRGAHVINGTP